MSRRLAIGIGLVLVAALSFATVAVSRTREADRPSDRTSFARHRDREQRRPLVPRTPKAPEPEEDDENATKQSGSSEGGGVHIDRETEHHRISGSGSIAVTSGAVDEGTGGGESHGSFVGPRRPKRR